MTAPTVREAAAALHRDALVLDSHNDSIVLHIRYLRGLLPREQVADPQISFPRCAEAASTPPLS